MHDPKGSPMFDRPTVMFLLFLALPLILGVLSTATAPGPTEGPLAARRRRQRGGRLTPKQASAVEAAVARVITAGPEYSGNTIQLPCRECGRRQIPPVEHVDSPRIPTELATLVGTRPGGWQITATCTECYGPLISRMLDEELAHHALSIGVVEALQVDH